MVPSNPSRQVLDETRGFVSRWLSGLGRPRARAMTTSAEPGALATTTSSELTSPQAEVEEPREAFVGPIHHRGQAREWALVLQSQGISFALLPHGGGWMLRVQPDDLDHAVTMIDVYEKENENWPPVHRDKPRHDSSLVIPLAFIGLALFFFYATGPVARGSVWFTHGRADALRLASEPWRMVTALTLHADAEHIIGNMISGTIFGTMVARRIGPGGALLSIVIAGALGNTFNALYHLPDGHRSIGASTGVFAAVGLLAAVQTIIDWGARKKRERYGWVDMAAPIIGGLTLLGMLGAGKGNTDVWAHGFGFLAGVLVGAVVAWWVRKRASKPSRLTQGAALVACIGLVVGAWALALL